MYVPVMLPVEEVVKNANMTDLVECMCGQQVCMLGKSVVWTHKTDDEEDHWFLSCHPTCYTRNVTDGAA